MTECVRVSGSICVYVWMSGCSLGYLFRIILRGCRLQTYRRHRDTVTQHAPTDPQGMCRTSSYKGMSHVQHKGDLSQRPNGAARPRRVPPFARKSGKHTRAASFQSEGGITTGHARRAALSKRTTRMEAHANHINMSTTSHRSQGLAARLLNSLNTRTFTSTR